jgi:hypothetical protein
MDFNKSWKSFLEEISDPQFVDVSSFKQKDTLAPEIWNSHGLSDEVRSTAIEIAQEFFETLQLDPSVLIKDIILTGSLATYNWSEYSDFDLHILIDFSQLEDLPLLEDYFRQKTRNWNSTHKITFGGYEVELYIQDSKEEHHANGIYSLMENRWLRRPSKFNVEVDYDTVKKKASRLMDEIDNVYDYYAEKDFKTAQKMADVLMERIKKYRRAGLSGDGIYSTENLVFKTLRRNNYLQKLSSLRILAYDGVMSLGYSLDEVHIEKIKK